MIAANDWTGSSAKRQEQGGCVNYGQYPSKLSRWYIPAGTAVSVCRVTDSHHGWQSHTTKEDVPFCRSERSSRKQVMIRYRGWFILTTWDKVRPSQ